MQADPQAEIKKNLPLEAELEGEFLSMLASEPQEDVKPLIKSTTCKPL